MSINIVVHHIGSTPRLLMAAALALAVAAPSPAVAGYVTGAELSSLCRSNMGGHGHVLEAAECLGYIVGVADTFDCTEDLHGFHWNHEANVSQVQLVTTVLRWLDANPDKLSYDSASLISAALAEAYPCKQ
jgi:hypothetical protein